jgi:F420H(2)-dependent quinone reductase
MPLQGEYAPLPQTEWIRTQIEAWERSGGTDGTTVRDTGVPCVIVVNRGAKSGKLHRTPVIRVEHDGRYVAVGSRRGAPKNPGWVTNLRADPQVEVWDGPDKGDYTARELFADEREEWWERAVAVLPNYAEYQQNTDRQIPVFLLEPAS